MFLYTINFISFKNIISIYREHSRRKKQYSLRTNFYFVKTKRSLTKILFSTLTKSNNLISINNHPLGSLHWPQSSIPGWNSSTCRVISYKSYLALILTVAACRTFWASYPCSTARCAARAVLSVVRPHILEYRNCEKLF